MTLHHYFGVVIPLANEEKDFYAFIDALKATMDQLPGGTVYLVVDKASKDNTLSLCRTLSEQDNRFVTVWAPENKSVVDAYRRGMREAFQRGHDYIIEMDGGLSHDPATLPHFLQTLKEGYDCAFGSRNIPGGSNANSPLHRRFLSTSGTLLANLLLGTRLRDMTSGYQGFQRRIVQKILDYPVRSTGHFYQTEIRYLLKKHSNREIPIHYHSPSPRVKMRSILNSLQTLGYYTLQKLRFREIKL